MDLSNLIYIVAGAEGEVVKYDAPALYSWVEGLLLTTTKGFARVMEAIGKVPDSDLSTFDKVFENLGHTLVFFFFTLELFATMVDFHFERPEDAVRVGLKYVCAKVIIENANVFVNAIYKLFYGSTGLKDLAETMQIVLEPHKIDTAAFDGGVLGINYFLPGLVMLFVWIIMLIMLIQLLATVFGIIFEIMVHKAFAPIALSTLCNSQARSAGIAWIKSFSAVCLQITVMKICFLVYDTIMKQVNGPIFALLGVEEDLKENIYAPALEYFVCLIGLFILTAAIKKSGDMTKRMLGA